MNLIIVSHCDFDGNSALHALAFATLAHAAGVDAVLAVPNDPGSVRAVAEPAHAVVSYQEVLEGRMGFADGRAVDLIHSFTPREHVRRFTEALVAAHACRYVVHLEDNEWAVLGDHVGLEMDGVDQVPTTLVDAIVPTYRMHPRHGPEFIRSAAAATLVIERLVEHIPESMARRVIWPGFDESFRTLPATSDARERLGLPRAGLVVGYSGNVHHSNVHEVRSLYLAVRALRERGLDVFLLRTGWDQVEPGWVSDVTPGDGLRELGFVDRGEMPHVLAAADLHVQPGGSGRFNDYRFPSKLPDCLVSGKPVATGKTNIGLHLADAVNGYLMDSGDALEIAEVIEAVLASPARANAIGAAGRGFALRSLAWADRAAVLLSLYSEIETTVFRANRGIHTNSSEERRCNEPPVKTIAFYLPQFHTIPENDAWWGRGFTEWTNVRAASPQFSGHYQPHVPTALGYYDLSDSSVLDKQAELARRGLVYGFCLYHYWFDGHRLLEGPLEALMASDHLELPFCVCWANENWTRRWDGQDQEILIAQTYSAGWEDAFLEELLPTLSDRRYINVNGAPLLLVYRVTEIPAMRRVTERWRAIARRELGTELHLAAVQSFGMWDPRPFGFDAAIEFPPHTPHKHALPSAIDGVLPEFEGFLEDYREVIRERLSLDIPDFVWYRGAMPSWDNSARRGTQAHVLVRSSPALYECWLRKLALQAIERAPVQEPLVFVNAWNEWAEGTHLEPDSRYGFDWLDATAAGIREAVRQHWTSRGLSVDAAAADQYLRTVIPEIAQGPEGVCVQAEVADRQTSREDYRGASEPIRVWENR